MKLLYKKKELFLITALFCSSVFFNQYYGNIGVQPIDSFFPFNSGYDVLKGYFPFRDYWTITGPFIDVVQALFFKIFGVSWFSYVLHASIFNFIFVAFFFYALSKLKLNINYCFLYSFFLSLLAYPSSGTPYVDHQSSYLSAIAVLCFILALKTNSKLWWFILPIIFGVSFLTKQTPTGYVFLIISFLSLIHFIFNFDMKKIIAGLTGSLLILAIFFMFMSLGKISLISFIQQYILFPMSFGESRLGEGFLFPLEFQRVILRFKLIHLSAILLFIVAAKNIAHNYKYLVSNEFLSISALIGLTFSLIAHQLMTINGIYIYFLIPILIGFSHIYFLKYFKSKIYILYLLIFLCTSSTVYYGHEYINKRNFMDLDNANISKAIDAKFFDKKLSGLKWITPQYPDNPKTEMSKLQEVIQIIKNDTSNKVIVTDYQFISVILSSYDNSPNKVWYSFHVYPSKGDKYFDIYQKFFVERIKDRKIETVYTIKPLFGDNDVLKDVLEDSCVSKIIVNDILEKHLIKKECNQML